MALTITKDNFDEIVLKSDVPVMVDFWAAWCGPCRMVGPFVDEIAQEYEGRAKVGKINVDEQQELAQRFKVMTIPTIMVFRDGEMTEKIVGSVPKTSLADMLENAL